MTWFFIAIGVFLLGHVIPGLLRARLGAMLGERLYIILFSVTSLLLLAWVIYEEGRADYIELWPYNPQQHWVPLIAMVPVSVLWAAGLRQPCPLSLGRRAGFDPARPGINRFTRHPLLLGMAIWGFAHLVPNGHLAALLLFGGSAIFALIGFARMEKIRARGMPDAQYQAILAGTRRFDWRGISFSAFGWRDIVGGILLYGAMLLLHPVIIGVGPLPF
ncbi:MAG: NnrU family protein [Pseudomonadota bacterium]